MKTIHNSDSLEQLFRSILQVNLTKLAHPDTYASERLKARENADTFLSIVALIRCLFDDPQVLAAADVLESQALTERHLTSNAVQWYDALSTAFADMCDNAYPGIRHYLNSFTVPR